MTNDPPRARIPWELALGATILVAALRAALIALKDGYVQAELYDVAAASSFRHIWVGLAVVSTWSFAGAFAAARGARRSHGLALGLCALLAVLDYLFLTCRVPSLPFHAPAFEGARAWGAHACAAVAAAAASIAIVFPRIASPAIARTSLACGVLVLIGATGARAWSTRASADSGARPNVIVISLDTLRADRIGAYGYARGTTPAIDRFAQEAVRFERAFCPQAWTLTSHMTLLTSLYPTAHGVDMHRSLATGARTLASHLSDHGYRTAAQVDRVVWLEEKFGFKRGFDVYRRIAGGAAEKNAYLASLLDDLEGEPFFLLLHYFDAHSDFSELPYEAPKSDRDAFAGDYRGKFTGCDERARCGSTYLWALNEEGRMPTPEDLAYIEDLYDAGVAALDRDLERLFDDLRARGLYDSSIIVLTSDHGEEFGEHGMFLHEQPYDECLAVPLFVRLPGGSPSRVSSPVVGLVDVAPTLLELCGIEAPDDMQGESLVGLLRGDASLEREGVMLDWGDGRFGIRTAEWKLFHDGARWHLYDLVGDPGEHANVYEHAVNAPIVERLMLALDAERARTDAMRSRVGASAPRTTLTESDLTELRSLGYAGKE